MIAPENRYVIRKIPIGRRIFFSFLLLILLTILMVLVIAFNGLRTIRTTSQGIAAQTARSNAAMAADAALWRMMQAETTALLNPDNAAARADYQSARTTMAETVAVLNEAAAAVDPDDGPADAEIEEMFAQMQTVSERSMELATDGEPEAALRNSQQFGAPLAADLSAMLGEYNEDEEISPAGDLIASLVASRQQMLLLLLGGVGLIVSVLLTVLITRTVVSPIREMVEISERFATGDFANSAEVAPDEVGQLAASFNRMGADLQASFNQLQSQTQALRISADVSRQLTTILEMEQLVVEVVEQIRNAFGYYHVHIYLLDDNDEFLKMAGGTGSAGQTMLAANHRLERGQGLVGRAATNLAPVLVPDVAREPAWLPNELLPETRAELALPLIWRGELLGVLDVQHNLVNGLTETDQELLQTLGNQIAVALQNARSYAGTQQQAERELKINTISQKIQRAKSIDNVLKTAITELGETLAVEQAVIRLERPSHLRQEQPPAGDGARPPESLPPHNGRTE